MKIYLLDINPHMTKAWEPYFKDIDDVEIVNTDFNNFMYEHANIEAIVSPANAFGLMDGGYDGAITYYFGRELMKDVQEKIITEWYGEQPVGTSISIPIKNRIISDGNNGSKNVLLIHTPTMRTPEKIIDYKIIYQCMRTTLIEAIKQNVNSIVIPAFGGCSGGVDFPTIAKMMYLAYTQINNKPDELSWSYAMGSLVSRSI
jgi:O-acetyl-ADP-ribose deacetylase (regulator of RNase III)